MSDINIDDFSNLFDNMINKIQILVDMITRSIEEDNCGDYEDNSDDCLVEHILVLKDYKFELSHILNELFSNKFSNIKHFILNHEILFERYDLLVSYYKKIYEYLPKSENIFKEAEAYFFSCMNAYTLLDNIFEIESLFNEITNLSKIILQTIEFRKEEITNVLSDTPGQYRLSTLEKKDLELKLNNLNNNSLKELLIKYITEFDIPASHIYNTASIGRETFNNILGKNSSTKKERVVSLCIALHLNLEKSIELIQSAGHSFDPLHNKFDMIIANCITNSNFDFKSINTILEEHEVNGIGSNIEIRKYNKSK